MDPAHTLPPAEHLLPAPHRAGLFWTWLAVMDVSGVAALAFGVVLGQWAQTIVLGIGLVFITVTALANHRHNRDHHFLLAIASIITILVALLRAVAIFAPHYNP
jgi:Flp pilus assembly protein TadB